MPSHKQILIAIDDSEASYKAVQYIGNLFGVQPEVSLCLCHVLSSMPPSLLEMGGSENPREEEHLEAALHDKQDVWMQKARQQVQPMLDRARTLLTEAGVSEPSISIHLLPSVDGSDVPTDILHVAQENDYDTVVVGYESFSAFKELMKRHVAYELIDRGKDLAIWVIK